MRTFPIVLFVGLLAPALAQGAEPSGCDKFKWPMTHEQAALAAEPAARLETGAALAFDAAAQLHLAPFAEAKLDMPPQRAPKLTPSYAGAVKLGAPAAASTVKVSISGEGWIDVVQDGHYVKPTGFAGATDCPGLRKSVKFPLAAAPATIQISNVRESDISLIVSPE
jgi:hypothetical protein